MFNAVRQKKNKKKCQASNIGSDVGAVLQSRTLIG